MEVATRVAKQESLCGLARNTCNFCMSARPVLEPEVVAKICRFISEICKQFPDDVCQTQSQTCYNASVCLELGKEKQYLRLCAIAVVGCPFLERMGEKPKTKPLRKNNNKKPEKYIS